MNNVQLSPPWSVYFKQINELFKRDPDINLKYNEDLNVIKLEVTDGEKAVSLAEILPSKVEFGNVTVTIKILVPNDKIDASCTSNSILDHFKTAFRGNPAFVRAETHLVMMHPVSFILFEKSVVQYYCDDLSDANGCCSTLYQELAKIVFGPQEDINFCTDVG